MNIVVLDDLDKILSSAADTVKKLNIGTVSLIDNGDGRALPNYAAGFPAVFGAILMSLNDTVGIDIQTILRGESPMTEVKS